MSANIGRNTVHVLVAAGIRGEIGAGGGLPWAKLSGDMRRFRAITRTTRDAGKKNAVIMGRRTWDSLGRVPLSGRVNVVLSRQPCDGEGAVFVPSVAACCALLNSRDDIESAFLIGGGEAVSSFMKEAPEQLGSLYITYVIAEFPDADAFVDLAALEAFFPVTFHRTSDYDGTLDVHFALRWQHLSDL